jgi:hypothetical protein
MAHQSDKVTGVALVESHSWTDRRDQFLTALGVVSWVALADVVQKSTNDQQIGPGDPIGE